MTKTLFYDPIFDYWFKAKTTDFLRATKDTSHSFIFYGAETVENFYLRMGVEPPKNAKLYGWKMDENWIEDWQEYCGFIDIDYSDSTKASDCRFRFVKYFQEPKLYLDLPDYINHFYDGKLKLRISEPVDLQVSKWISVKDRLPEKECEYIICISQNYVTTANFYNIDPEYNPNNPYCIDSKDIYRGAGFYKYLGEGEYEMYDADEITHWMPLPESPVNN